MSILQNLAKARDLSFLLPFHLLTKYTTFSKSLYKYFKGTKSEPVVRD